MQKFGLDTLRSEKLSALEREILKETATALGRAGRKLRRALDTWQARSSESDEARLIDEICRSVWELVVQREFAGFVHGNLEWVRKHYAIPAEAVQRLGYDD